MLNSIYLLCETLIFVRFTNLVANVYFLIPLTIRNYNKAFLTSQVFYNLYNLPNVLIHIQKHVLPKDYWPHFMFFSSTVLRSCWYKIGIPHLLWSGGQGNAMDARDTRTFVIVNVMSNSCSLPLILNGI